MKNTSYSKALAFLFYHNENTILAATAILLLLAVFSLITGHSLSGKFAIEANIISAILLFRILRKRLTLLRYSNFSMTDFFISVSYFLLTAALGTTLFQQNTSITILAWAGIYILGEVVQYPKDKGHIEQLIYNILYEPMTEAPKKLIAIAETSPEEAIKALRNFYPHEREKLLYPSCSIPPSSKLFFLIEKAQKEDAEAGKLSSLYTNGQSPIIDTIVNLIDLLLANLLRINIIVLAMLLIAWLLGYSHYIKSTILGRSVIYIFLTSTISTEAKERIQKRNHEKRETN